MQCDTHLETELRNQLDWVTSRRWFGDKARPVLDVKVVVCDRVQTGPKSLLLVIARFSFEWGPDATYFIPLLDGDAPLAEREATTDPHVLQWLVEGFSEKREIQGHGIWRWRLIGDEFPDLAGLDYRSARPISGEQSNTSVIFDGRFMGKIFRKIPSGTNPDLEIGEHMMRLGTFNHVPALYGVIDCEVHGERIDIAAMQEFVPNVGYGWSWLLAAMQSGVDRNELLAAIRLLGTRTGEMHIALAESMGDAAFAPVTIGEDDAQTIIRRVIA